MDYIAQLNEKLADIIVDFRENNRNNYPIFIVGAPRSGSTLVFQAVVSALSISYPTNLIARFWSNPVVGLILQNELFPGSQDFMSSFNSIHGYSRNFPLEPHEFGYFWSRWFDHSQTHYSGPGTSVDESFKKEISNLMALTCSNWCFKNLTLGLKISLLKQIFPEAKFIIVNRNPHDIATSLLQGRKELFGDVTKWWSLIPKEIKLIKDFCPEEQVVAQIFYTYNQIYSDIKNICSTDYIEIEYVKFCNQPNREIYSIAQHFQLSIRQNLPELFSNTPKEPNFGIQKFVDKYFSSGALYKGSF